MMYNYQRLFVICDFSFNTYAQTSYLQNYCFEQPQACDVRRFTHALTRTGP